RLDWSLVERRDQEDAGLGCRHVRALVHLHLLPVHLDAHAVEHARRRLAGADRGEFLARVLDVLVHRGAGVLDDLRNCAHLTRVPTRSPRTAETNAPGRWMLRTINGSEFSRQSVIAV